MAWSSHFISFAWRSIIVCLYHFVVFRPFMDDTHQLSLESAHLMQLATTLSEMVLGNVPSCYWAFREAMTQISYQFPHLEVLDNTYMEVKS